MVKHYNYERIIRNHKNALEHGWALPEIRESLINSGYVLADIDAEISKFSQTSSPVKMATPKILSPIQPLPTEEKKTLSLQEYQLPKIPEKKHKGLKIFITILAILFFGFLSIVVYAFISSLLSV